MDNVKPIHAKIARRHIVVHLILGLIVAGVIYAGYSLDLKPLVTAVSASVIFLTGTIVAALTQASFALIPFKVVRQAILHVSNETSRLPAPNVEGLKWGRETIAALVMDVYDMASQQPKQEVAVAPEAVVIGGENMLNATPLPLFTITAQDTLHYINDAALTFLELTPADRPKVVGKNINDVLNLAFPSENTFESWLNECRSKVLKAGTTWERVRYVDADGNAKRQFDMAASYNKATSDVEAVIVLFDHTDKYNADDQEISFVAMAVHELRTPLTIMRGYIEVFEEELGPTLQPELKDFMHKMNASAQQLTAFVSNILNVARVEENQLTLQLQKQSLPEILTSAVADLELRAKVHGKHIDLKLPADLPDVAADRISLHEVINNLVDNAIKYSDKSESIVISAEQKDGLVQVNVQDFGVGIPEMVVPKLFDKFYRSHRSKVQIGGTGLGLYLCKAIITAHGGNIWVKSHEGEGSIFSFTLETYDTAKHGEHTDGQDGITRGAHGWIKNHSMYRR